MPSATLNMIAHADWSVGIAKRWLTIARRLENGEWLVAPPQPVGEPGSLLFNLQAAAGEKGCALVGFDFPIGLPLSFARQAGITDFLNLLPGLGSGEWADFYRVAERAEEISLRRPFYPRRPNGCQRSHLTQALGVASMDELLRHCERALPHRKAACPLFWTLGAQQVGKAAISGWKEVLAPALSDPLIELRIWPFSGTLDQIQRPGTVIVVETYPAECYHRLGIGNRRWSKRRKHDRQAVAPALLTWVERNHVRLEERLQTEIINGFGEGVADEDRFDAVAGVLGMLDAWLNGVSEPTDPELRKVEGWIFGQAWDQQVQAQR